MSCNEIARLSDIPLPTVTRIFNGSTPNPTFETFAKIAIALGVSLDEIAGMKHPDAPPVDAHIESTLSSYAELLHEKDVRIREKDDLVQDLRAELKEEKKRKARLAILLSLVIAGLALIVLIDFFNGHIGFVQY